MNRLTFTDQIAIAIFYPLAVGAFFSFLSSWLSGRNATKNAQRQNDLAARMKLADFRQAWINELRNCLSESQSRGITSNLDRREMQELRRIATKIRLLMNKQDTNYAKLDILIAALVGDADQGNKLQIGQEMTPLCQDILKAEWEVLKRDLSYMVPLGGVV
jgi:hypothetical protein